MRPLQTVLLGGATFDENEEYAQFRFRLFYVLLICGVGSSSFFILGDHYGTNPIGQAHVLTMQLHLLSVVVSLILLYGRKRFYYPVAWCYAVVCYGVFISALYYVPQDELRILWFFLNVPGVYLLLGRLVGVLSTLVSIICVLAINPYLSVPYSANAQATFIVGIIYLSAMFYAYSSRSISYFERMVESKERLRYLADHDPLTGIMNARSYYAVCDTLISLARREERHFAVLFVDLDHFKKINDQYGHEAGDTVLKVLAVCLKEQVRSSDLVGRVGGEEFSIFLPNTDPDGAKQLAENLRAAIEALMPRIGEIQLQITASIGVAGSSMGYTTISSIQCRADQAMYVAKQQGRNRVSCCDEPAVTVASA